jgi:glycosyltransferase involved in cell wall biosynthesis
MIQEGLHFMKIALLGPGHPFRGGIVHFNSRLAIELKNRDDLNVDLYYWKKPYPESLMPGSPQSTLDNESFLTFHNDGLRFLSYTNPLSWMKLVARIQKERYDIFITHWVHPVHFPVLKFVLGCIRLFTKTEIIIIVHNVLPHERFRFDSCMTASILKMAHRLIVHSNEESKKLLNIADINHKPVVAFIPVFDQFTIGDDISSDIRSSLGLKEKVILFFGFIRPYKGLDVLLEAFHLFAQNHPDTSLLIVGESFYHQNDAISAKNRFLANWPLDDPVRSQLVWIDRYVPNEEVSRYFTAADLLVVPYLSVTQSAPLQIAYAFDKPVIASDLPAFRECVSIGESGYLFETGNAPDLAKKMEGFFAKPIRGESVQRFRQKFGWEYYVNLILGKSSPKNKD